MNARDSFVGCQAVANQWRSRQPPSRATSGVVLIWNGSVYGWKDKLRNAEHERPEAIAVDPLGNLFIAQGGNDQTGAKHWVVVTH